jgi:hypothetical protein
VEEAVKQRIKYLVEHGEPWPKERRRLDRRIAVALIVCVAMNVYQCIVLMLRH